MKEKGGSCCGTWSGHRMGWVLLRSDNIGRMGKSEISGGGSYTRITNVFTLSDYCNVAGGAHANRLISIVELDTCLKRRESCWRISKVAF